MLIARGARAQWAGSRGRRASCLVVARCQAAGDGRVRAEPGRGGLAGTVLAALVHARSFFCGAAPRSLCLDLLAVYGGLPVRVRDLSRERVACWTCCLLTSVERWCSAQLCHIPCYVGE